MTFRGARETADDAWSRQEEPPRPNGADSNALQFEIVVASTLAGRTPPVRQWLVQDWIPLRQVTLLTGDGETGKTLLALQLMVAAATGGDWLGLPVMRCSAFGLFAEDDDDELHRRLANITEASGVDIAALGDLAWRSAVIDPCELVELDRDGQLRPTEYFEWLRRTVIARGSRFVVLDAATNLYGGDEIKRRQVNAFIALLRRLAIEIDGVVLLLAHPSAHGMQTGSGLSGSTHWHNAVRSRLYFKHPDKHDDKDDTDPDERILECRKANYARSGGVMRLRWREGAFIALGAPSGIDRIAEQAKADRVFFGVLRTNYAASIWVSPHPNARNYAPTILARHPDREGLGKAAFEGAMYRLLNKSCQIKIETYGRPSEPRTRLAPS